MIKGSVKQVVGNLGRITTKVEGFTPSMGTVTAGPVPYNVMNHLEDQIQLAARKAFGDGTKGTGEATPKKKSVPDWLKERWEAGNNFNKENRPRYPYNEVELEAKEVGGKKYVVDSYAPNKEIVSRKFTQLSEVQEKTAKSYLNEITIKYSSGSKISNGTFNPNALKGGRLKGELILEVPVQNKPIPQTILDEATKNRIIIRDIKGKVYN
ncbi:hypothetical protein [Heyndrickxia sporothermodurans]|uniref:hypothetical protein n=2 Tax=Heyndrickxia TaxID=2837504 RepID=UPI001FD1A1FC|nr:hypothetical protein [Heyndrickxia sporothermodurans]